MLLIMSHLSQSLLHGADFCVVLNGNDSFGRSSRNSNHQNAVAGDAARNAIGVHIVGKVELLLEVVYSF
jgi:hypothetical protein